MFPTRTDPVKLRALAALLAIGLDRVEACQQLRISRRTYFRRKAELGKVRHRARQLAAGSP